MIRLMIFDGGYAYIFSRLDCIKINCETGEGEYIRIEKSDQSTRDFWNDFTYTCGNQTEVGGVFYSMQLWGTVVSFNPTALEAGVAFRIDKRTGEIKV